MELRVTSLCLIYPELDSGFMLKLILVDNEKSYVYVMSNISRTIIYIGATTNLKNRIDKHINGKGAVFTKKYHLKYLVYYEVLKNKDAAFKRERQLKNWKKAWKWNLIKSKNPNLEDLYPNNKLNTETSSA